MFALAITACGKLISRATFQSPTQLAASMSIFSVYCKLRTAVLAGDLAFHLCPISQKTERLVLLCTAGPMRPPTWTVRHQ